MSDNGLSNEQAHRAMFIFVENIWKSTGRPADLASLLSDNQRLQDGGTADPAAWDDWLKSVEEACATGPERLRMQLDSLAPSPSDEEPS